MVSVSPCDCNGGARKFIFIFSKFIFIFSGTLLQQPGEKLISNFIGTVLSLFITDAHRLLLLSWFTEYSCSGAW